MDQVKKDLKSIKNRMYKFNCIHDRDDLYGYLTLTYTKYCKDGKRNTFFKFFDQRVFDYIKTKNRVNKQEMLDCNNPNTSATMYQEHNCKESEIGIDENYAVRHLINKLDDVKKTVIVGIFYEKKNAEDLAEELNMSVSSVSLIKSEALKLLKKEILRG